MVVSMDRWRGKVAVVTGASAGCGAAIAERLVEEGLQVVGLARRLERVQTLAEKLKGKPGKLHAVQADVSKEEDILKAFKWTKDSVGPVNILVNSAGISKCTNLMDGNVQHWRDILNTNLLGLCICTKEALASMKEHDIAGHIVHINSVFGHHVLNIPDANMYPASKFGVTAVTETLRQELNRAGSKIKVTSLSPGPIETEFFSANGLMENEEYKKAIDALPKLQAEDVVDACIYILSTPPHVHVQELMVRPIGETV